METILMIEEPLRLGVFLSVLGAMALWEIASPQRRQEIPRVIRWSNNFALVALDTVFVRLAFPLLAVEMAAQAQENGWGLFNLIGFNGWFAALIAILVLDFAIYLQHRVFHAVPFLWRLHRMHHADLEFDVSTGLRFHPVEIVLSMGIKIVVVIALGAPAAAVLIFEVILSAASLFNHSNIQFGKGTDCILRRFVVTPDMHRVHHSIIPAETNSNFGFSVPWWDYLVGTYVAEPTGGQKGMTVGIEDFRSPRELWLDRMITQPLRNDPKPTQD